MRWKKRACLTGAPLDTALAAGASGQLACPYLHGETKSWTGGAVPGAAGPKVPARLASQSVVPVPESRVGFELESRVHPGDDIRQYRVSALLRDKVAR